MLSQSGRWATRLASVSAVVVAMALVGPVPRPVVFAQDRPVGQAVPDAAVALRRALNAYLTTYEAELGEVTAFEHMTQRVGAYVIGGDEWTGSIGRPRTLESDVAFVALPGGAGWLGYRDVIRVNGRPLRRRGGPSLADLLSVTDTIAGDRARALLIASAAHNLGAPRTINLPSLPLEMLHPRHEPQFTITAFSPRAESIGGCRGQRLDLSETARPTLVQRPAGGDMSSRISAWIEERSGRLCRAEVTTRDAAAGAGDFETVVAVDFGHDEAVGLTVPVKMREVFYVPPQGRGAGEASYTKYRRFKTSGRVLPPGARQR